MIFRVTFEKANEVSTDNQDPESIVAKIYKNNVIIDSRTKEPLKKTF